MFNSNMPSLSDIAAVTGNNGFGGGEGWWVLIILFALFGGWGNGGNGWQRSSVQDNYVLASDFSNIERKIDSVNNGLCDGFYAMNTSLLNGFNNIGTMIMQGTNTLQAGQNAISGQIQRMGQDIMMNCNNNYRALHDELVQARIDAKDEKIAEQAAIINNLNLRASQEAQNNYLVSTLRPTAIPAYQVENPYYGYGYNCCNRNSCCC